MIMWIRTIIFQIGKKHETLLFIQVRCFWSENWFILVAFLQFVSKQISYFIWKEKHILIPTLIPLVIFHFVIQLIWTCFATYEILYPSLILVWDQSYNSIKTKTACKKLLTNRSAVAGISQTLDAPVSQLIAPLCHLWCIAIRVSL